MFDRLDFWVTSLSLLLMAIGLGRYIRMQLQRPAGPTTRPTLSSAHTAQPKTARRRYGKHTGHTALAGSMPDIDAANTSMKSIAAIPPVAPAIPPVAPASFDRDTQIRVLLALGWSGNKIAAELGGDRNAVMKRVRELKAEQAAPA